MILLLIFAYLQRITGKFEIDRNLERIATAKNSASQIFEQTTKIAPEIGSGYFSHLIKLLVKEENHDEKLAFFISRNDTIVYWTSDKVPLDSVQGVCNYPLFDTITLSNGEYLISTKPCGDFVLICTILNQQQYPFENRYLKNSSGTYLWMTQMISLLTLIFFFTFYIFSDLTILAFYIFYFRKLHDRFRRILTVFGFFAGLVMIRIGFYVFRIPDPVYDTQLFNPAIYSSGSLFPSLGDLLLHLIGLLVFLLGLNVTILRPQSHENDSRPMHWLTVFYYILVLLTFIGLSFFLITDIVLNSTVSFDLSDFEGISFNSIYGIFAILLILVINIFIAIPVINAVFLKTCNRLPNGNHVFGILSLLLVCLTCEIVYQTMVEKEKEVRRVLAAKILTRQNPVNEEKLDRLRIILINDTLVQSFFRTEEALLPTVEMRLQRYMEESLLNTFRAQYSLQVTFCDEDHLLTIQPKGDLVECGEYFTEITQASGRKTDVSGLWQMDYGVGPENYLLALQPDSTRDRIGPGRLIVVEFTSKYSLSNLGYPALLLNDRHINFPNLSGYSFAIYQDGNMVHSLGSANYPMLLNSENFNKQDICFYTLQGYNHLRMLQDEGKRAIIISRKDPGFLSIISLFSYLLILFLLFFWILDRLAGLRYIRFQPLNSLKGRLQIALTGAMVATLLVVGTLAIYYITALNARKNSNYLKEKSLSLLVELQHKLSAAENLTASGYDLESLLIKFSNVFFTDINLFDPEGKLIASSRSQIFGEGIISRYMNPVALEALRKGESSLFTQKEHIGTQYFSSAYLPVYNNQDRLLGYMNLPYFSKQDELSKEISGFLNAFINLYFLIILSGIVVSVLISRRITRPLEILALRLSQVKLGQSNELLEWRHKDEIGHLVSEYNRMVTVLAESTKRLARSERESAWREMARQVAHEIKNPLTPMKLSIQHLKKAWDEKSPDWEFRMERLTRSLILQIDQLSSIATDFSDFARMDEPVSAWVELDTMVKESLEIFNGFPGLQIHFNGTKEKIVLFTDPRHFRRILTNLINNSIQSKKPEEDCLIQVTTGADKHWAMLEIRDNGPGIPAELIDKVFQPYFTTRSGGTGLGLAIVKGLIQIMNGEIELRSDPGSGTLVRIKIPINDKNGENQ